VIDVVVFDLGGVLCRFDPDARVAALAAAAGLPPAEVQARIWGSGLDAAADRGELDEAEAFAVASLDGRLDRATVVRCWATAFAPDDAVLAQVDRVSVRRALLTNNGPLLEPLFDGVLAPVAARLDPLMPSWRLGATKPSPAVYERAAERCAAGGLLLVDDNADNVAGAIAAGWDAVRFTGPAALARELDARGVTAG
jgi:putative hydrolase of the HAD superfamily